MLRMQEENKELRAEARILREELEREAAASEFAQQTLQRKEDESSNHLAELNEVVRELTEDKTRLACKLQAEALERVRFRAGLRPGQPLPYPRRLLLPPPPFPLFSPRLHESPG